MLRVWQPSEKLRLRIFCHNLNCLSMPLCCVPMIRGWLIKQFRASQRGAKRAAANAKISKNLTKHSAKIDRLTAFFVHGSDRRDRGDGGEWLVHGAGLVDCRCDDLYLSLLLHLLLTSCRWSLKHRRVLSCAVLWFALMVDPAIRQSGKRWLPPESLNLHF